MYVARKKLACPELADLLPRWQFNSAPTKEGLGVLRFAFDLFSHAVNPKYGVAEWVPSCFYGVLEWRPGIIKTERTHAICIPRDFSKSTWFGQILPLYAMLVGQYGIVWKDHKKNAYVLPEIDYIRLRGKSQEKAEEKLSNVTAEFRNPDVIRIFGDLEPSIQEVRTLKLKNQAKLLMLKNGYIFQAQGINQPSRGANLRNRRPKLDINDDIENKENTKTVTSRMWNRKEILGEQFGGLVNDGLTVYIGNYVHDDCLLARLVKKNSGWKSQFFQATYIDEKGNERSLWPERHSLKYIRDLGEWYKKQGEWAIFMMEYYNRLISEHDYMIRGFRGEYFHKNTVNWLRVESVYNYDKDKNEWVEIMGYKPQTLRVYPVTAGDPAISTANESSDGCAVTNMFASDLNRYVYKISLAKFDNRDRYVDWNKKPKILATTAEELGNVSRLGLVEEIGRHILRFNTEAWVLEKHGQQAAWFNDIKNDILRPLGRDTIPALPYFSSEDKTLKIQGGLLNQFSAGRYFFNIDDPGCKKGVDQVSSFNAYSKKDILDALYMSEQMKVFPPTERINPLGDIEGRIENPNDFTPNLGAGDESWTVY